jgi:hypothetical protein
MGLPFQGFPSVTPRKAVLRSTEMRPTLPRISLRIAPAIGTMLSRPLVLRALVRGSYWRVRMRGGWVGPRSDLAMRVVNILFFSGIDRGNGSAGGSMRGMPRTSTDEGYLRQVGCHTSGS